MVKFSLHDDLGREEEEDDVRSILFPRSHKKQRTTTTSATTSTQQAQQNPQQLAQEEEEEEDETEYEEEEEEEEDEEDEEEEVSDHQNEDQCSGGVKSEENTDGELVGPTRLDGSMPVILTDPDVLDCPICLEPLNIPVFQCENGHIACSSCCIKVGNKCPSCSWPIGYNRCRAIEKVLESVKISCPNRKYGCKETLSYSKKHDHEETCMYSPCSCPLRDCGFVGSSKHLFLHFSREHPNSAVPFVYNCLFPISFGMNQKHLILREQTEGTIFILNRGIELLGDLVNVNFIGPRSSSKGFSYNLIARKGDSSLRLISFTESIPTWVEHVPEKGFLVVPNDFPGSRGQLSVEVSISRRP